MDFLVHTTEPSAYDEKIRSLGSRIIPCLSPSQPLTYAVNFRRVLREYGPYDVVHTHQYLFNSLPIAVAAASGVRGRISHIYPRSDIKPLTRARSITRRAAGLLLSWFATETIADSHASLRASKQLYRQANSKAGVVYCGIPLGQFSKPIDIDAARFRLGLPLDKPVVTYVARFVPHKNHAQILRIADLLNHEEYRYHFVLAGSHGPLKEQLLGKVRERQDVSVLVGLPDISELLLASDLFCFPSLEEGFGMVAVEAAAAGLPVVATNLPAIREACAPSNRAYMFPPNDDASAARKIDLILGDPALRQKLGKDARSWAQRFSIERSTARLAAIYDRYAEPARAKSGESRESLR